MPNNFRLFFSGKGDSFCLPVNPAKLPVAHSTTNDKYNVLGLGEIMAPRLPNLRTLQIASFFPGRPFSGVLTGNDFRQPEYYIRFFRQAQLDKIPLAYTPVRYYENGEPFMTGDYGFDVLVTAFDVEERGGETGDFYYELELTEYKDYSPVQLQVKSAGQSQNVSNGKAVQVTAEKTRKIPAEQLYAGCAAVANGNYYYTSAGDEPHGSAAGRRVLVQRILGAEKAYPVHITDEGGGALGWIKKESLQAVSNA